MGRDFHKACQGARELRARRGGCIFNVFDLTVSPHEVFLFPDGFISFEPTVGPKRSVTVKAKYFYGTHVHYYLYPTPPIPVQARSRWSRTWWQSCTWTGSCR